MGPHVVLLFPSSSLFSLLHIVGIRSRSQGLTTQDAFLVYLSTQDADLVSLTLPIVAVLCLPTKLVVIDAFWALDDGLKRADLDTKYRD